MRIVVTGATGFIGSRLRAALLARGHVVVGVSRHRPPQETVRPWFELDFAQASGADWREALTGIDVVVNTVGIFREQGAQTFEALHVRAARTLFLACVEAGVRRVVQLSALGADEHATTAYHLSKRAADEFLLGLPVQSVIAQPSLVFGTQGASARVFLSWASLPLLALPAGGRQLVQPVHVDDAAEALATLVDGGSFVGQRVALVGPCALTLEDYLQALRHGLHLSKAPVIAIPAAVVTLLARLGDPLPRSLFDSASWQMLQRGNSASARQISHLLGRPPRTAQDFIPRDSADAHRNDARLAWLLPLLRLSIAFVWIFTGIVSLGLYPLADSEQLLARAGVPSDWRLPALFGAAALDLLLGVASLLPLRRRRALWLAQSALILLYTAIITFRLPEFWLHPYAPMLKNLPMLAALLLLAMLEPPARRHDGST